MVKLVRTTLILKQYQSQRTGEFIYLEGEFGSDNIIRGIHFTEPNDWKHTRTFKTEIKEVKEIENVK